MSVLPLQALISPYLAATASRVRQLVVPTAMTRPICETVARECSNGYYEYADGIRARYVRVTGGELPYGQALRISGLRVFGNGEGAKPAQAEAAGIRVDALDAKISWQHIENAQGCNVRYGIAPDKLYLSWLVYDADEVTLSTLTAGQEYYKIGRASCRERV